MDEIITKIVEAEQKITEDIKNLRTELHKHGLEITGLSYLPLGRQIKSDPPGYSFWDLSIKIKIETERETV